MTTHNATSAKLRTAKVITACRACIHSIDESRAEMKENAIKANMIGRGFFGLVKFARTREQAEKRAESEYMFGAPWHYRSEYQRNRAERLLDLAERTEYPDMYVSPKDYATIRGFWA